jgi:Ca2+-binding EF-hand superfamily protein
MPTFSKPSYRASSAKTEEEQARLVFNTIDDDLSDHIEVTELAKLLVQWGCPDNEVVSYFKAFDRNGDGKFSFDEFFTYMKPIWQYMYSTFLEDEIIDSQQQYLLLKKESQKIVSRADIYKVLPDAVPENTLILEQNNHIQ